MLGIVSENICLPMEMLDFIRKNLSDADCLSLSLSGGFEGFDSLYFYKSKRKDNTINIIYKYFFLMEPRCLNAFFSQHPSYLSSITILNLSECYWMPADLICGAITKMSNLEELGIKGTKVSLPHLSKVFENCGKIKKLDFNFLKKKWETVKEVVEKLDVLKEGFKKLVNLKISTCFSDAKDYTNDPWLLIIHILTWCKECTELAIEVSYACGYTNAGHKLSPTEKEVQQMVKRDLFPLLDWMANLTSLVLTKLERKLMYSLETLADRTINSHVLQALLHHIFREGGCPSSLQRLWVHRFYCGSFDLPIHLTKKLLRGTTGALPMKSFYVQDDRVRLANNHAAMDSEVSIGLEQRLNQLEHVVLHSFGSSVEVNNPRPVVMPKLKYFRMNCCKDSDVQMLDHFITTHPELEHLHLHQWMDEEPYYVPNIDSKLINLRVFSVSSQNFHTDLIKLVEKVVDICPNIEVFRLQNVDDMGAEALSNIRFPKLSSLHLYGPSQLNDGTVLLSISQKCPKLRSLHIGGTLDPTSFIPNFERFLKSAGNLRDLRLRLDFSGSNFLLKLLFESIQRFSPDLERLVLFDTCWWKSLDAEPRTHSNTQDQAEFVDFMVQFTSEMKHLTALCVCIPSHALLDGTLMEETCSRIEREVVSVRPSLWVHMNDNPGASLPDAPGVHYNEMIDCLEVLTPPF